ncbi:helix-turn-helix protein [Actinophytocola oryzae]|uniref:Helix-turn-helix protein n=1 Tax=Actinophytocola oryzae TaxID=502181 RepID=A0A4R7W459_9PSEU|nr:helix-turn-helix protein [Actinophytocola oryzae]
MESAPRPALAGVVRTVWVQHTGAEPYAQRNLPTGGVELVCRLGGLPRLTGPLTRPDVDVIAPHTTVVGVRFSPGTLRLPVALDELADQRIGLDELWGHDASRLGEAIADAPAGATLDLVQDHLASRLRPGAADPLVAEAVRRLMPWRPVEVASLADDLAISASQLRRRFLRRVGIGPKPLQRTLRFQGFLALAQAGVGDGLTGMALDAGYADHAHLCRECLRLTGLTPRELLGAPDRCACGHDHSASYRPFLADLRVPAGAGAMAS